MVKKQTVVCNETGLHARPASDFVSKAKSFSSSIKIRNMDADRPPVSAKSIIRILGEGMGKGTRVEVIAEGEDEARAAEELVALIDSGFGE